MDVLKVTIKTFKENHSLRIRYCQSRLEIIKSFVLKVGCKVKLHIICITLSSFVSDLLSCLVIKLTYLLPQKVAPLIE